MRIVKWFGIGLLFLVSALLFEFGNQLVGHSAQHNAMAYVMLGILGLVLILAAFVVYNRWIKD
ncbi:hypothetical protein JW859_14595 [bacterium]|nr:hypothetical protein [bacterium]